MDKETIAKVVSWLEELDAWTIYEAAELERLPFIVTVDREKCIALLENPWAGPDGVTVTAVPVTLQTPEEVMAEMKARGLGGSLMATAGDRLFVGYRIAETLVVFCLEEYPAEAARMSGRGSRFQACLDALRKEVEISG